jgi:hypothetical protein
MKALSFLIVLTLIFIFTTTVDAGIRKSSCGPNGCSTQEQEVVKVPACVAPAPSVAPPAVCDPADAKERRQPVRAALRFVKENRPKLFRR